MDCAVQKAWPDTLREASAVDNLPIQLAVPCLARQRLQFGKVRRGIGKLRHRVNVKSHLGHERFFAKQGPQNAATAVILCDRSMVFHS